MSTEAQPAETQEPAAAEQAAEQDAPVFEDPVMASPPQRERPQKAGSRRDEAQREAIARAVEESRAKDREEIARLKSEYGGQISQLTGSLQTMQQMIAQQREQQAKPQTQEPDPDSLRRDAKKALDDGRFEDHERLTREAYLTEARKAAREEMQRAQPQQQQPLNPVIMTMLAHHRHVAMAGDQGAELVRIKDAELGWGRNGLPPGPERMQKAFAAAEKMLEAQSTATAAVSTTPQFSQASAAVLSGVPTARGPAGAPQGPGKIRLSAVEKDVAKRCGMSEAEYERHLAITHPERIER